MDVFKLEYICYNLFVNVFKFILKGGCIEVVVSFGKNVIGVDIVVMDIGVGIFEFY